MLSSFERAALFTFYVLLVFGQNNNNHNHDPSNNHNNTHFFPAVSLWFQRH